MAVCLPNLFSAIPSRLPNELITPLVDGPTRIERIVSRGHASPDGFWYDQPDDEFVVVVQGAARVAFVDRPEIDLVAGDICWIPARCRHRVSWTDPQLDTIWLAVHMPPAPGARPHAVQSEEL